MSLLYICTPYSHPDPAIRQFRYQKSCRVSAKLIEAGIVVFNPLLNSVPAVELGHLPCRRCLRLQLVRSRLFRSLIPAPNGSGFIPTSGSLVRLDGRSLGVRQEMFEALSLRKPVTLIREEDIEFLPKIPKHTERFLKSEILTEVFDA